MLELNEIHERAAPGSGDSDRKKSRFDRSDELVAAVGDPEGLFYLKIDTQGYERAVLEGAAKIVPRCAAIQWS